MELLSVDRTVGNRSMQGKSAYGSSIIRDDVSHIAQSSPNLPPILPEKLAKSKDGVRSHVGQMFIDPLSLSLIPGKHPCTQTCGGFRPYFKMSPQTPKFYMYSFCSSYKPRTSKSDLDILDRQVAKHGACKYRLGTNCEWSSRH